MFSVTSRTSPTIYAPLGKLPYNVDSLNYIGTAVEYGEFVPVALNHNFITFASREKNQFCEFKNLPYYFGVLGEVPQYHEIIQGDLYNCIFTKIGMYNYTFIVSKGMLIDFYTQKPLIVVAYLKEYEDSILKGDNNNSALNFQEDKLLLFVDRNLKNTSFLRNFLKLYPAFKEKVTFNSDLEGFLDGIKFDKIKGSLQDFKINSINNFLKENKVDESVLSGEQDKLLEA